jgi:glutathione S-transferase
LTKLNGFLNGRKFAAGDNLTYIDFHLFEMIENVRFYDEATFDALPHVKSVWVNFSELP